MSIQFSIQKATFLWRAGQADSSGSGWHPVHAPHRLPPGPQLGHQPGPDGEPALRVGHGGVYSQRGRGNILLEFCRDGCLNSI